MPLRKGEAWSRTGGLSSSISKRGISDFLKWRWWHGLCSPPMHPFPWRAEESRIFAKAGHLPLLTWVILHASLGHVSQPSLLDGSNLYHHSLPWQRFHFTSESSSHWSVANVLPELQHMLFKPTILSPALLILIQKPAYRFSSAKGLETAYISHQFTMAEIATAWRRAQY